MIIKLNYLAIGGHSFVKTKRDVGGYYHICWDCGVIASIAGSHGLCTKEFTV